MTNLLDYVQIKDANFVYYLLCLGRADQIGAMSKKLLDRSLGSFTYLNEKRDSLEHTQDNSAILKTTGVPQLVPPMSFNDVKFVPSTGRQSLKKTSAVIRLSFKRRSCEGEESSKYF